MVGFTALDYVAIVWFVTVWASYAWVNDVSRWGYQGLSRIMNNHRASWMHQAARREVRIVDTQILASLQNGTAFFASTSLLALGGSFTLLSRVDQLVQLFRDLPISAAVSVEQVEIKILILCAIYGYSFFQFGWAYRLFNYTSILLGSVPSVSHRSTPEELDHAQDVAQRPAAMQVVAGRHFNWGLRALFFSIGYLGFFVSAWMFMITTTFIAVVMYRRQYYSAAKRAAELSTRQDKP